jgi:hypothetical protein
MYRMLMIGLGAALVTFGLVGIALSDRIEIQRRQDLVLVCQRAGASVSSFTVNLSTGDYVLGTFVWVHNNAEAFYSVSDANRTQVVSTPLATTDQSSEWKYSEGYFQIIDSGDYTFELFNATFSSVRSFARLSQRRYVDEYLYPYRSFLWVGVFSLVVGVPLVVVGLASPLMHTQKEAEHRS